MLVRQHVDNAWHGHRLADVDGGDAALGDCARDNVAVQEAGRGIFRSIFRASSNFQRPVDAPCRTANVGSTAVVSHDQFFDYPAINRIV